MHFNSRQLINICHTYVIQADAREGKIVAIDVFMNENFMCVEDLWICCAAIESTQCNHHMECGLALTPIDRCPLLVLMHFEIYRFLNAKILCADCWNAEKKMNNNLENIVSRVKMSAAWKERWPFYNIYWRCLVDINRTAIMFAVD